MVYASFLLLLLQPDLLAVSIQKKVARVAEGAPEITGILRKSLSLFEKYQEPLLPDSDAMKAGGLYLSPLLCLCYHFSSYLDQNFHMKETSFYFMGG